MKILKHFSKAIIALILAFSMITLAACDVFDGLFGGGSGDGNEYTVTLVVDGGTLSDELDSYTSGTETSLPTATKEHYSFVGWFENSDLSGNPVSKIAEKETGDKTYYAKWSPDSYLVKFVIDGADYASSLNSYAYGVETTLPLPDDRTGYTFNGWYANSALTGGKVSKIAAGEYGFKTYYGEWKSTSVTPPTPDKKKYTVNLVVPSGAKLEFTLTEYTEGEGAVLPNVTQSGYTFGGWYLNSSYSGAAYTEISKTDTGNKTFYAKMTPVASGSLEISGFGGYEEGAYVEFKQVSGVSSYTVEYKKVGASSFTAIDSELIRVGKDGTVRADIVGVSAGEYTVQVKAGGKTATKNVTVTSYDRSGYAHFNYTSGVGAYKDDGTPKSGATIVYVTEENKNTVTAGGYTGLVKNLQNANKLQPLIVRIVGTVGAATWNKLEENNSKPLEPADVVGMNGTKLIDKYGITVGSTSSKEITQATLIKDKMNTLNLYPSAYNGEKCEELLGLSSKIKYDSSKKEFDSCWNDCSISGAENITVEGIGADAKIFQWGMTFKKSNSVEVRNITFDDYTEDACSFEGSSTITNVDNFETKNIWIHNNTFLEGMNYWDVCNEQDKHDGDGSTDFKGVSYVTISYNHYVETHKTGLIGGSNSHLQANITFHHNYYESCKSRLPLARQANMHMYNNYYHGTTGTSISLRAKAYAFIEYCYFDGAVMIEIRSLTSKDEDVKTYGVAKVFNCLMKGSGYSYNDMPASEMPKDNKLHEPFICVVTDRAATVANNNSFSKDFDTNSSKFYYDSTSKQSKVTNLIKDVNTIPQIIPTVAGVHKN